MFYCSIMVHYDQAPARNSPHEFVLAVRGDEADRVLGLELAQLDALNRNCSDRELYLMRIAL